MFSLLHQARDGRYLIVCDIPVLILPTIRISLLTIIKIKPSWWRICVRQPATHSQLTCRLKTSTVEGRRKAEEEFIANRGAASTIWNWLGFRKSVLLLDQCLSRSQLSPVAKNSGTRYYIVTDIVIAINTRKYCDIVLSPYRPSRASTIISPTLTFSLRLNKMFMRSYSTFTVQSMACTASSGIIDTLFKNG